VIEPTAPASISSSPKCEWAQITTYKLQSVRLRTGTTDQDGRLVFINDELTAVIVLLAGEDHAQERGLWSMEADFRVSGSRPPLFNSPYDAVAWLLRRDEEGLPG